MAGIGSPTQDPHVERLIRTIKEERVDCRSIWMTEIHSAQSDVSFKTSILASASTRRWDIGRRQNSKPNGGPGNPWMLSRIAVFVSSYRGAVHAKEA